MDSRGFYNDDPPMTRRENDRLFQKIRKLMEEETDDTVEYNISRGKLYKSDTVVKEFNLSNQPFC